MVLKTFSFCYFSVARALWLCCFVLIERVALKEKVLFSSWMNKASLEDKSLAWKLLWFEIEFRQLLLRHSVNILKSLQNNFLVLEERVGTYEVISINLCEI